MALGQIFREARESKGMSIAEAAEATRILFPVIEGLEAEDFRRIAAPIYGRGFIKIYAEVLGLDPNPLLNDYAELQAGGGHIKPFSRPAPLLPPKPEPVAQEEVSAEPQPATTEEDDLATEASAATDDFCLEPEERPTAPRRRNYSFVADSQGNAGDQQSQTPEKNWLFSRDKTKPIFSKPVSKPTKQRIHLPKIKIPSIQLPHIQVPHIRILDGLKTRFAGLKYPAVTPPIKKALIFVSAGICLLVIIAGLRLAFKPAPLNVTAEKQVPVVHPETHVKASRILMPDPYID